MTMGGEHQRGGAGTLASVANRSAVLYGGVGITVFIVVVIAALTLSDMSREVEARSVITTQNLARSITLMFEGLLDTIDVALASSAEDIGLGMAAGRTDPDTVTRALARQQARLPAITYLRAMNEAGDLLYGPDVPFPPQNNASRDYFVLLKNNPGAGLLVRKPVVGHVSQEWIWSFARRITKPDGSFGGAVIAAMFVDRIGEIMGSIKMPAGVSVTLRYSDRSLIASYHFREGAGVPVGDARLSSQFAEALARDPNQGTFTNDDTTSRDGIGRTASFVRSGKYGFIVVVGESTEVARTQWRKEATVVVGLVAVFFLVVLGLAWQIDKTSRRREQAAAALETRSRELEREVTERKLAEAEARTARIRAEEALDTLLSTQKSLVQAEKMASLGALVAGIAHEVNTPVGVSVTGVSHLAETIARLRGLASQGELRRTQFETFMSEMAELSDLVLGNLHKAARLINAFKQVAADRSADERCRFNLHLCLENLVASLRPCWQSAGHTVTVACPDDLELESFPGTLDQILTNLVVNSVTHAYEPGQSGHIAIEARALDAETIEIVYADDGRGIPEDLINRVFDPFFTTRRHTGSTGLGLHIVFNLVTTRLRGTLRLESADRPGVRFTLNLPKTAPAQ